MSVNRLFSAAFCGLEAILVEIELDLLRTPGTIRIVGLPDAAVKESKDRVWHALKNSGFANDALNCTVHLAPADIRKIGAFYDLPIALGLIKAQAICSFPFEDYLIAGELGLTGATRPISGALALSLLAHKLGKKGVILPHANAQEAACMDNIEVIPIQNLKEAVQFFQNGKIPFVHKQTNTSFQPAIAVDMNTIKGQAHAKRALEIAAAGRHNILMSGPPGSGKTMLAKAFSGILPPLNFDEALEVTNVYSIAGKNNGLMQTRPFRSPHHTISAAGMVGGSSIPKPGEITLAHKGVLFLDELPEFSRCCLEVLRQPLEDKQLTISRAGGKTTFPTDFIFIAAMNPCPCGYLSHSSKPCTDSKLQIERYRRKISGPLLDRIDIHLEIPHIPFQELMDRKEEESSSIIRERVIASSNRLSEIEQELSSTVLDFAKEAVSSFQLSARAYSRLLKVARTIAAMSHHNSIQEEHLAEAISYRLTSF